MHEVAYWPSLKLRIEYKIYLIALLRAGASISSETMMHLPPVSDSPLLRKIFFLFLHFFTILPFPEKFLDFHPPSHRPQILNFPLFSLFQYISPLFRENYSFPPTFTIFPFCFRQIHLLFTYFMFIFFLPL